LIGAVLVISSGLLVQIADHDIDWFDAHPAERGEMLRRCHSDYRLADTPICMNAEASGTRELGRITRRIDKPYPYQYAPRSKNTDNKK
jgi:hypothetical protein